MNKNQSQNSRPTRTLTSTNKVVARVRKEIVEGLRSEDEIIKEALLQMRHEALGWMHAEACVLLDNGLDIRKEEVPSLIDRAERCLL